MKNVKVVKIFAGCSCPFNYGRGGIEFDDGTVLIDLHEQDCCENVYADFSNLDSDIMSYNFKGPIQIKEARNGFKFGDGRRWFFVPCYNEQNGYYNNALSIAYGSVAKKIVRYSKGKAIYGYKFFPITTLDDCPVKDEID